MKKFYAQFSKAIAISTIQLIDIEPYGSYIRELFFVGHIAIAFILSYFIITRFQVRNVSLSLVLFLSILPDIDILFGLVGFEIAHRSITHSIIIFAIPLLIFSLKYRASSVTIYLIAYISHLVIGDIIVGPSNLLSPFGHFDLNGWIYYMGLGHILVESIALAIMAIVFLSQYLSNGKRNTFPIKYSKRLDPIFYPLVMAGIVISSIYLYHASHEFEFPDSFSTSETILILHIACLAIVALIWITTRNSIPTLSGLRYVDKRVKVKTDK